jgi:NTP pyrophosphatase (non-canonical NTP hydrolase)
MQNSDSKADPKVLPALSAALCSAVQDVLAERQRQDAKWGEQNHDPFCYLTILMEEVGELSQAALHARFGGPAAEGLRKEAVQTAAVALAIVECLDRGKWEWSHTPNDQAQTRRKTDDAKL